MDPKPKSLTQCSHPKPAPTSQPKVLSQRQVKAEPSLIMMESQRSQQVISQTIKNLRANNNPENFVNPQQFLAKRLFD